VKAWWNEKAWPWLKKWGAWILGGIALVLGSGWLWNTYKGKLGRVKDKLAVAEALKEREKLQAVRTEIAARVGEKDEAIEQIDRQLEANARKFAEAHEGGEDLTDEELLEEFARQGL
jgi:hypothetical protein